MIHTFLFLSLVHVNSPWATLILKMVLTTIYPGGVYSLLPGYISVGHTWLSTTITIIIIKTIIDIITMIPILHSLLWYQFLLHCRWQKPPARANQSCWTRPYFQNQTYTWLCWCQWWWQKPWSNSPVVVVSQNPIGSFSFRHVVQPVGNLSRVFNNKKNGFCNQLHFCIVS